MSHRRVQYPQAIEQMLNVRWWPRLFFGEQNPKPFSYFLTDCSVVFWIEVEGHCISLMQFALPEYIKRKLGNRSCPSVQK